jgi:hypothetical protein
MSQPQQSKERPNLITVAFDLGLERAQGKVLSASDQTIRVLLPNGKIIKRHKGKHNIKIVTPII